MRRRRPLAALVAPLLLATLARAEPPRIYAHRGVTAHAPENSLAACRAAFALGASCEVDVRSARGGELVLMHDASVSRTTNGRGRVERLSLARLRGLALRGTQSERVPTLEEALALERGAHALLLDLKRADAAFHARLAGSLARAPRGEVVLGVRSAAQARALRSALARTAQLALIERPAEIEALAATGAEMIRLRAAWLERDPALAARVRAAGARLLVRVEERDAGALDRALAHAPDAILCDDPSAARARLARAGAP